MRFKFFKKILKFIILNKFLIGLIIILIIGSGYYIYQKIYKNTNKIYYLTEVVKKGDLITSVTGSGQISVSNQIDIKSKVASDVVFVNVKNGQEVKAGTLIVKLDSKEAEKNLRDAEINLELAKLSLEKLKKPADNFSIIQAENSLNQAKESKQKFEDDLKKSYEEGFNIVANAMLELPEIMIGIEDMMFDNTIDPVYSSNNISWYLSQVNYKTGMREKAISYKDDIYAIYSNARKMYDKNFDDYKKISRIDYQTTIIENLILQTYDTTKIIADTIKTIDNYIDFVQDDMEKNNLNIPKIVFSHQTNLNLYTSKINFHLLNLLKIKRTIEDSKNAIVNADRLIIERKEFLNKLNTGADSLDIKSLEFTVKQKENFFKDAQEKLADYFIRAPFDGVISKINVKKGDKVSFSMIVSTLITKQKIAEISLNELDIVNVKIGQKATLTFDAIPNLIIEGEVVEIDVVGNFSQGVVSYNVKIAFNSQDNRIKPGMNVTANIITEMKSDIIFVSNSAIKSQNGENYVEVVDDKDKKLILDKNIKEVVLKNSPHYKTIKTGISNDEFTEIISGLNEGDIIIIKKNQIIEKNRKNQNNSSKFFR